MRMLCSALVAGLLFISNQAFAQVKEGSQTAGFSLGFGIPMTKIAAGASEEKSGKMGLAIGFGYDYQIHKNFSVGGDFNYKAYGKNSVTGGDLKTKAWTLLAMAKGYYMPEEKFRPYGLLGLGMNGIKAEYTGTGGFAGNSSGFAFVLGGGADYDINDQFLAGGELRYDILGADKNKVGKSTYNGLDFLLHVGYKFGA